MIPAKYGNDSIPEMCMRCLKPFYRSPIAVIWYIPEIRQILMTRMKGNIIYLIKSAKPEPVPTTEFMIIE
jgi:hypothetical protein